MHVLRGTAVGSRRQLTVTLMGKETVFRRRAGRPIGNDVEDRVKALLRVAADEAAANGVTRPWWHVGVRVVVSEGLNRGEYNITALEFGA